METAKVKVLEKIGAATARRHDIIKQRVQQQLNQMNWEKMQRKIEKLKWKEKKNL